MRSPEAMRARASSRSTWRRIAVDDLLDAARLGDGAPGAQPLGLAHQRLQRRLQPVREVGGARPGAGDVRLARVEQRVDLGGERPHLGGEVVAEPPRRARAHRRHPRADRGQRPQPDDHLHRARRRSAPPRAARGRGRGRGAKPRVASRSCAAVDRDRHRARRPRRSAAAQRAAARAASSVSPCGPATTCSCGRPSRGASGRRMVPSQSERDTSRSSRGLDLPVEARQRLLVARVARRRASSSSAPSGPRSRLAAIWSRSAESSTKASRCTCRSNRITSPKAAIASDTSTAAPPAANSRSRIELVLIRGRRTAPLRITMPAYRSVRTRRASRGSSRSRAGCRRPPARACGAAA